MLETPIATLGAFLGLWLLLWLPLAIPLACPVRWYPGKSIAEAQKLPLLASLYGMAPLALGIITWSQGTSWSTYGLSLTLEDGQWLGLGLGIGILGLSLFLAVPTLARWLRWQAGSGLRLLTAMGPLLLLSLWISGTEELVFRGLVLTELIKGPAQGSYWLGAAIASGLFALSHLLWQARLTLPQLPGLWLMGMVLALARSVDQGSLALACGLHTGWIWVLISLDSTQVTDYTDQTPQWLMGYGYHPLSGWLGFAMLILTGGLLYRLGLG